MSSSSRARDFPIRPAINPARPLWVWALPVLILAGPPSTVLAESPVVAVLDLQFVDAAPALRKEVAQRLTAVFSELGYRVLGRAQVRQKLKGSNVAPGCTLGPCLRRVGRVLGADRSLVGGVAGHGSSYDLVLTLLETRGGTALAQVSTRCDVCTFDDMGQAVMRAARSLHSRSWARVQRQGRLVVKAPPAGASVWLDGVPVGASPLDQLVAPGMHHLEVKMGDRVLHRRRFRMAARGELVVSSFSPLKSALARRKTHQVDGRSLANIRWPAWLALGLAGGLSVAGATALALDEGCPTGRCPSRRSTEGLAWGLWGAAAVATAVSGVLFWRYRLAAQPRSDASAARVSLSMGPNHGGLLYSRPF